MRIPRLALLLAAVAYAGVAHAAPPVAYRQIATGLDRPVYLTHAGDGSGRLFVVLKGGEILVYKNGALLSTPFLDISSKVEDSGNEQGLLSVAFHPNYENNGRFYVFYTAKSPEEGALTISEFTAQPNSDVASPTERVLLSISHPVNTNHNGGLLKFGPDGFLYAGTGDGGSADDPPGNGQNVGVLLGKILRIDVDSGTRYGIPADNPFANGGGRPEIYAYGLRNPWRFSFDRATGKLWAGDVGQNRYEEIDIISKGGNYGWDVMEGFHCHEPATGCDMSGLIMPIFEYSHTGSNGVAPGCSITGGYVYRGSAIPSLVGRYVFADYCGGSRTLYTIEQGDDTAESLPTNGVAEPVTSFGEDEQGELYVITDSGFGGHGSVLQLVLRDGACDVGCPADVTVADADGSGSEAVEFTVPQPAGDCGAVTCTPASGSTFPLGTTDVRCTSAQGNSSCTFQVTVTNAAGIAVTGCTPSSARRKATVTVQVTGSGFAQGATVSFGSKVKVLSTSFVSPSRVDVQIKVGKKAKKGARDVVVTNPGGASATGAGCFTVQ